MLPVRMEQERDGKRQLGTPVDPGDREMGRSQEEERERRIYAMGRRQL